MSEAVARLRKNAEHPGRDANWSECRIWLFLALAYSHLGQTDEARRWLDKAVHWLEAHEQTRTTVGEQYLPWPEVRWQVTVTLHLLRREAQALIDGAETSPRK